MLLLLHLQRGHTFFGGQALGCRCMIDCLRCTIMPSACCRISAAESARVVLCCQNNFCASGLRSKAITYRQLGFFTFHTMPTAGWLRAGPHNFAGFILSSGRWQNSASEAAGRHNHVESGAHSRRLLISQIRSNPADSGDTSLHPLPSSLIGATSWHFAALCRLHKSLPTAAAAR